MKLNFLAFLLVPFAFLFSSCDMNGEPIPRFAFYLQGTWAFTNYTSFNQTPGTLVIDFDIITINNYEYDRGTENRPIPDNAPFRGITRGSPFRGYSENNMFVIIVTPGISYYRVVYSHEPASIGLPERLHFILDPSGTPQILERKDRD